MNLVIHMYFEEIEYICIEHSRKFWFRNMGIISLDETTYNKMVQKDQIIKHREILKRNTEEKREYILKASAK